MYMEVDMYVVDKAMLKVIQVPDDYKECPVCHKWFPSKELETPSDSPCPRRSCSSCYNLPFKEFEALRDEKEEFVRRHFIEIESLKERVSNIKYSLTKDSIRSRFEAILDKLSDDGIYNCQVSLGSDDGPLDYSIDDLLDEIEENAKDYSVGVEKI
jgi:hypothetical protein